MQQSFLKTVFLLPALVLLFWSSALKAELVIEINEGFENAIPIALVPFAFVDKSGQKSEGNLTRAPQDLAKIVGQDLQRSGRFKAVSAGEMPRMLDVDAKIKFNQWRPLDIDNMLIGTLSEQANGRYQIDMRFMDVLRKRQVVGKRWTDIPKKHLRQVGHQIADIIYEELTGIPGAFNTQIAYVTLQNQAQNKKLYTLEIADADGVNPQPILRSSMPIMSPSWSPDGKKIAYVSFENGRSNVVVQSLDGQYRKVIADYKGINSAPAWSPDGSKMALTLSKDGSADIYVLDLNTQRLRQLTRKWSIETEAAWAPNGRSIYFSSDRRGQPQVFQVFLGSGEVKRITFEGKYNANPEISPDGRLMAVVHGDGAYHIGIQNLETNQFDVITNTFLDESPSFSPNGEMVLYALNKNGRGELAVVAPDRRGSQTLKVRNGEVREPAWGPYLKGTQ